MQSVECAETVALDVHDHIRLRQHKIVAIPSIGIRIRARHVNHAGTTGGGETVCGSSCGRDFSTVRDSTEMISNSRSDAIARC